MGRDSLAEVEFDRGLELASPEIESHYRDVSTILREGPAKRYSEANEIARRRLEEVLWRKSDPLYLSSENEVRVAHLARVAFADLMYEDPSEGLWGSETERGVIYVRYGPPQNIWYVQRDASRELSEIDMQEAFEVMAGGGLKRHASRRGGGRWIFWNYGREVPNFIFKKLIRWRHGTHLLGTYSKAAEEAAREFVPAHYRTNYEIVPHPAQLARFKGETDSVVELDVYSEVPVEELMATVRVDSLEAGVFLFAGPEHTRVLERSIRIAADRDRKAVTYSLPLRTGRYSLSLEARVRGGMAAVRREEIELAPFPADRLSLSDLVLAEAVTPLSEMRTGRRDFALKVARSLKFESDEPLALYWEVYGLTPSNERTGHYQVVLSITDVEGGGVLAKVVRALGRVIGASGDRGPELVFERSVPLEGDRVPEYVSLELGLNKPGEYRVRVEVTDQISGHSAVAERLFRVNESQSAANDASKGIQPTQ